MQTPLRITYHGLDPSPTFDRLIAERVARLERYHDRIIGCRVVVEVPHRAQAGFKHEILVKVEIEVPARNLIVGSGAMTRSETRGDPAAAVNQAFDAAESQLVKEKHLIGGATRDHASDGQSGLVVRLYPEQGYGFVEVAGSPDLYFTENAVVGGTYGDLEVGMLVHVTRATTEGPMGPQASSVRVLGKRQSPA